MILDVRLVATPGHPTRHEGHRESDQQTDEGVTDPIERTGRPDSQPGLVMVHLGPQRPGAWRRRGGLGPLPAWVRRHHRVHRWVWAKLIINGVRVVEKHGLAA